MATESFLKDVTIKKTSSKKQLIVALENAHKKSSKDVRMSRSVQKVNQDKIRDFFGDV